MKWPEVPMMLDCLAEMVLPAVVAAAMLATPSLAETRQRARDLGLAPGEFEPGPLNAITDVAGVMVGHLTRIEGPDIRTGVTAILPHQGNLFQDKVPAGFSVANGFGKFAGSTQLEELGEIETPILLTNTLNVPEAMAATIEWTLAQPGNERVGSVNAVVGETNDGRLNAIRKRALTKENARDAIERADSGPVAEGAVGAGTGTVAFGWKGGIGTSSRVLPKSQGGWRVGALVQSNYGGTLVMDNLPVGRTLKHQRNRGLARSEGPGDVDGSIILVIATDAPLSDRNLRRLAARAHAGLARTGAAFSNGSGDYAIAFSTATSVRRTAERRATLATVSELPNDIASPLFRAAADAAEEAILNSLTMAVRMESRPVPTEPPVIIDPVPLDVIRSLRARLGSAATDAR